MNEIVRFLIQISLKFGPRVLINNQSALVLITAWRWSGYKQLLEPMMVYLTASASMS